MREYCLIESRDPFESDDVSFTYNLAAQLAADGNPVTIFLVQNGVLPARNAARSGLANVSRVSGITVLADDFSLRERGISQNELLAGVTPSAIGAVIDCLERRATTIWH